MSSGVDACLRIFGTISAQRAGDGNAHFDTVVDFHDDLGQTCAGSFTWTDIYMEALSQSIHCKKMPGYSLLIHPNVLGEAKALYHTPRGKYGITLQKGEDSRPPICYDVRGNYQTCSLNQNLYNC